MAPKVSSSLALFVALLVRREGDDDFVRVWELGLFLGLGLKVFVE